MALSNTIRDAIKNIYRYEVTVAASATSGTLAITGVDMAKTELRFLGWRNSSYAESVTVELTNSTTLTAKRAASIGTPTTVSVELTERW